MQFDDIFAQLGLDQLSPEEKQKMMKDMEEIIENRITLQIIDTLSEEDKQAFSALNTDEEFAKFFESHNIDPMAIAVEEAAKFREEMIRDASYIQGQVEAKIKDKS